MTRAIIYTRQSLDKNGDGLAVAWQERTVSSSAPSATGP